MKMKLVRYKLPLWTVIDGFVRTGRWQRWHYVGVPEWIPSEQKQITSQELIKVLKELK